MDNINDSATKDLRKEGEEKVIKTWFYHFLLKQRSKFAVLLLHMIMNNADLAKR